MSKKKAPKLRLKNTKVTTGFSTATYKPTSGKSTYTLSEPLQAMRDQFYGAATDALPTEDQQQYASDLNTYGQSLFGTGSELLDAAQTRQNPLDYYNQQQALLTDSRATEEARLADTLFKSGRTGAATAYGGGYLNPEQFALLKAREEANMGMMLGAEDRVRALQNQDIAQATGIQSLGLGYQDSANTLSMRPYQNASTLFGVGTGIEELGRSDLQLALQQGQTQLSVDQAITANKAARQSSGGLGGAISGAVGGFIGSGGNPLGAIGGAVSGGLGYGSGGGSLFSMLGSGGSLFSGASSLFSQSSPSSGLFGSLGLSNGGFTNLVSPINRVYTPMSTGIGMGGYQAPANFGGGTIAPRWY